MARIMIIEGRKNGGKTTAALGLKKAMPSLRGFLSLSEEPKDEITLLDLDNGNRLPLMSRYFKGDDRIGCYFLVKESFLYASGFEAKEKDVVIIDEVGRLECSDSGFSSLLCNLLKCDITLIITVRNEYVKDVLERFCIEAEIFSVHQIDSILEKIKKPQLL